MYAQPPTLIAQAVQHFQAGQLPQATALLEKVLSTRPRDFDALHILGVIRAMQGHRAEAIELFRKALSINKNHSFLQFNMAKALSESGQDGEALVHHKRAIRLAPQHAEAWLNYGQSLLKLGLYDEALAALDKSIALTPQLAEAWSNKGLVYRQTNRLEAALEAFERALQINPRLAEAHLNKGAVQEDMGQSRAALGSYAEAARLRPDYADARWNSTLLKLKLGEFQGTWDDFELRWSRQEYSPSKPPVDRPRWNGERSDRALLLWGEQGIGDQILYASILPELADLPQRKMVALDKRLVPLFERSLPDFEFLGFEQVVAGLDIAEQLPLGSLPRLFRPNREAFSAARHPFLRANTQRCADLRTKINRPGQLVCGVSWWSNRKGLGKEKSISLEQLLTPLASDKTHFVNLQYGDTAPERQALLNAHGIEVQNVNEVDNFADIDGLAALIQACDVVITTSNTTAHLAGALGKRTLLLLPHIQGRWWYWGEANGHNLWYPSIEMFSQKAQGQWGDPVARIRLSLESMHENCPPDSAGRP